MLLQKVAQHTQTVIATALASKNITARPSIVLGLSGGPDSLFLFLVLKELQHAGVIKLVVAHLDHGWREESKADVAFCADLCQKHQIPFITEHAQNLAISIKPNGSQEEIGRKLRRFFLQQTLSAQQADLIALAHHHDDQEETFLLRLIRGTSLSGLHGMHEIDRPYIRPLLTLRKQDILTFLDDHGHAYLHDSTNGSDKYLRNKIRRHAIPALHACDARASKNIQATIEMLKAEDAFLVKLTKQAFDEVFSFNQTTNCYVGTLATFNNLDPVLLRRIILHWLIIEQCQFTPSQKFIREILRFLTSPHGGSHQIAQQSLVVKKKGFFWLSKSILS